VGGVTSELGGSAPATDADAPHEDEIVVPAHYVRPPPPPDMFIPLGGQLDNVRRWNEERAWGFAAADFEGIDLTPTAYEDPLVADVIAVFLPGDDELDPVRRTCHELWGVLTDEYPNVWCWDEKAWNAKLIGIKQVRVLHGIVHQPGLRRVTLDLGAHWDPIHPTRSIDVRSKYSAHAEVLAAAAHFPRWARAMDGVTVPYTQLSGYQVTLVEEESWRRLPNLSWNEARSTLSLTAHWGDIFAPRWSSPVCLAGASVLALDAPGSITWA
jgi:hypothetical protein